MLLTNPPPVRGAIYTRYYIGTSIIVSLVLPLVSLLPLPILGKVVRERIEFSRNETWPILKGIFVGYTLGSFPWSCLLTPWSLSWRMRILLMVAVGVVGVLLFWFGWFISWVQQQYRFRKPAPG